MLINIKMSTTITTLYRNKFQNLFCLFVLSAAPNEKMKDVLKRTISDAKASVSKVQYMRTNSWVLTLSVNT